ncbi:GM26455 [Drosophila sechellia]|uniref:GM26455 n=1 Tax=Drosophila sechellia TaxID=7238 RepID=B4HER4_DROSE|nr:GM26455 [Drosophila sechellia]
MERRKALSSYAKFKDQQEAAAAVTPQKDNESEDSLPALRRSHSVRSSLRRLKNKLHSPALSMQSPFKLRTQLHMRNRSSRGSATLDKSKAAKALRMLGDLDAVAVLTTKVKGKNEFVPLKRAMNSDSCDHDELGIERLMSSLPVGAKLPRKACKLLQIPESYCRQTELAPKATLDSDLEKTFSGEESSAVLADITRHAQQGIYGTTRMRTATIRKPMPYLNSRRCYHSDSTKLPNMPQKLPMSSCLRSPAVFVRQKSFHTLNELTRFCQLKVSPHRATATATATSTSSSSPSSSPAAAQQQRRHSHYAIDDNILPQDKRDGDIDSVRLREKVVYPSGGNNNNQDNYPTYYPAPLLSTSRWSEQLTQHAAVAKIRTAISCHSQDLKEMEFLLPHSRTDSQSNSQSQLCISRHSQPKNAKLRDDHDETGSSELDSPPLGDENASANGQLSVHRQPVQLRSKIPGNTPHPRASKMSKKQLKLAQAQLDKLTQNNLHLHALFSAVEHGHLEKARTILESTDVDVNSINNDGLSALDLAVLSNNRSMTRMLLQHGAVEGSQFSVDTIGTKLNGLLKDAESRIHDLSGPEGLCPPVFASRPSISSIIIGNSSASVTGCTGSEVEKQIGIWERRVKGLRRLQLGWDQARPPDAPASVVVDVTGDNSISVQILEPFEGAIGTKFKVQWSTRADFNNVVGESELLEWISFHGTMGAQCHISGLTQGRRYFLRAACGNVKGWGTYRTSVPASVVPSTWRDLDNREDRFVGRHRILDNLFTAVRLARPADVSELTLDPASAQRRNPKKKTTIKQLFSVTTKFQKTLRRGIYFSCIIHCDDKVLVTSEDFPPVIEVDESYPSALHMDYYWLMKVACTWEDVKSLRSDMERNLTSAVHFRTKLLSAVCQMQSALGITDLGQLYYKPLRDAQGTVVLTCVQSVKSQKAVSILNSRWVPVSKLQKKLGALHEDYTINELLISSIGDQLHYQQAALQRLEPGLYLGYLKMQCSMDQIQVVVPVKTPNVLPHCKVRENSHITAEEWQVLHRCSSDPLRLPLDFSAQGADAASGGTATTEVQRLFLYDLTNAMHKLFASMNIKIADATTHRLYDVEVIEHSPDISFLVVCPSAESSCAVPGQSELLLQRDDLASLSIQAFEMIHLRTYQPAIIQKYARLSCILELDTALATHSLREAFSSSELQAAKERLATLQELSASLTIVWKSVRWLMDVVAYARNKNAQPSLAMREILDFAQQRQDESVATSAGGSANKQLLQLPIRESKFSKTGQGRGSWPGPGTSEDQPQNKPEHSKSEQNLELSAITPVEPATNQVPTQQQQPQQQSQQQQLLQVSNISEYAGSICSEVSFRKNSGDSMSSTYTSRSFYSAVDSASDGNSTNSVFAIPPSRSDDTLADALRHSQAVAAQRKRTSSNIASHTNPLITVHSSSSAPYLAGIQCFL